MPISYTFTGDTVSEVFSQMRDALAGAGQSAMLATLPASLQDAYALGSAAAPRSAHTEIRTNAFGSLEIDFSRSQEAVQVTAPQETRASDATKRTSAKNARAIPPESEAARLAAISEVAYAEVRAQQPVAEETVTEEPVTEEPVTEEPVTEEPVAEQAQETTAEPPPPLDYLKDVTPRVLAYVNKHGKEAALALLGEFGVSNAKLIAPELWPELLERLA